jgi:6-pyruvoyltetrahydropterin/6-carboxytetrahydropterin synthase
MPNEEAVVDEARLIRTHRFRARHHYRRAEWSEEENRRAFGTQVDPHEHVWSVEVHVAGPLDPLTGWAVDLTALDASLAELTRGWDGGDLNVLVPAVADGDMMPSSESLARWLHVALSGRVAAPARVVRVRVGESTELAAEYPA